MDANVLLKIIFFILVTGTALPVNAQKKESYSSDYPGWPNNYFLEDWSKSTFPEGVSISANNWFRLSEWSYFDPAPLGGDPNYGYFSNRFRFNINANYEKWSVQASLQYVKQWSLPDDADGTPGGALGLGAVYFGHNNSSSPSSLYIKYLNINLFDITGTGINFSFGRFDYSGGLEKLSGNMKIDWLKKVRLDARLLGGFDWSIYQRSFDGFRLNRDFDLGQLSIAGFRPTQGGFESDANEHISQINVLATVFTSKPGEFIPESEVSIFHYYFDDSRNVPSRVDNSGLVSPLGRQDISLHTIGGHIAGARSLGQGVVDWLLWGVHQTGDWFEQDHSAMGLAIESGYQFTEIPWKPWIRIGSYYGSGDENSADNSHNTFYQMLPTVRKYAFTTIYNLMNNEDYFIQLILNPNQKLSLRTDIHRLRLSESSDLWYQGAGATQARGTIQGFSGKPSGGATDLGTSAEITAQYQLTKAVELHAFYGHVFGDDVIKNNFTDDEDFDFYFLETSLSF